MLVNAAANAAANDEMPEGEATPAPVTTFAATQVVNRLDITKNYEQSMQIFAQHKDDLKPKHVVNFFLEVELTNPSNHQQMKGKCLNCKQLVPSTGSHKFVTHIIGCPLVPADIRNGFKAIRAVSEKKGAAKREAAVLAAEESELAKQEHAEAQAVLKQQCIRAGLKTCETAAADKAIANFFYANAISFAVASSEETSLYRSMVRAIQNAPATYVPPNKNKLAGTLLDECYDSMWRAMDARDPNGLRREKFGSCYVSDGWDSCDNLPLINSAFISANDGGMYWRSVDTSGKVKSAEYCALLMIQDIYNYGPENVVLVITDTCNTMAKAWALVEDEFPWISVLCCQPHVVSLLLKDIGKEKEVNELIHEEVTVVSWFANHQFPLAKLREMTRQKLGQAKELVRAAATRFGTHTLVGERLLELKSSLQATVVDQDYVAKNYKDAPNTNEATGTGRDIRMNKGATTKKLVLQDDGFWQRVNQHVQVTKPLLKMLRRFDTSAPAIGKVYSSWFEAGEHLNTSEAPYKEACVDKHAERWAYGHSDFAAAAYVLDPEFSEHDHASNSEVTEGFMNVVEKIGILRQVRAQLPHFRDAWKKRQTALGDDPAKLATYDAFPTYPTAQDNSVSSFCQAVNSQLTLYRGKKGIFARHWVMGSARTQPAYLWWDANGSSCVELQYVARLVLSQPASASICERINSEFAFVKDPRRNKLEHSRANKLVALFHNLRLMSRLKKPAYAEPAVGWNDEDFNTGVTKYGVANYEGTANAKVVAPVRPRCLPRPEQQGGGEEDVLLLM